MLQAQYKAGKASSCRMGWDAADRALRDLTALNEMAPYREEEDKTCKEVLSEFFDEHPGESTHAELAIIFPQFAYDTLGNNCRQLKIEKFLTARATGKGIRDRIVYYKRNKK